MITAEDMKQLENACGIPKITLMENAGKGIYTVIKEKFPGLKDKRILIVAYHGNNGGDGFVAARYLCEEAETDILFIGDEERLKQEAEANFRKIEFNERIQLFSDPDQTDFDSYDIIIDAMLGIGASGELKEPIRSTVDLINDSKAFKIAVDIPTGLNPDTGEIIDRSINADLIITFHDIKPGLGKLKDKAVVVDIGIPKKP